ncbi:hypothetical protein KB221_00665 [Aquidulcibacter paucihalophilus]|nr:hypothetical protein KB221_00665 [Aquidulcibacter paucihalophilus]
MLLALAVIAAWSLIAFHYHLPVWLFAAVLVGLNVAAIAWFEITGRRDKASDAD